MYALLFDFSGESLAEITVQRIVCDFNGGEDEWQVQYLQCRHSHGPTSGGVQSDVEAPAHECVIHVLVIVELARRVHLHFDGAFGFFIDFLSKFFYALGQVVFSRQLVCQFQFYLLAIAGSGFLISAGGHAAACHHACHCHYC